MTNLAMTVLLALCQKMIQALFQVMPLLTVMTRNQLIAIFVNKCRNGKCLLVSILRGIMKEKTLVLKLLTLVLCLEMFPTLEMAQEMYQTKCPTLVMCLEMFIALEMCLSKLTYNLAQEMNQEMCQEMSELNTNSSKEMHQQLHHNSIRGAPTPYSPSLK